MKQVSSFPAPSAYCQPASALFKRQSFSFGSGNCAAFRRQGGASRILLPWIKAWAACVTLEVSSQSHGSQLRGSLSNWNRLPMNQEPSGKCGKQRETSFLFIPFPFHSRQRKAQLALIHSQAWWEFKRTGSPRTCTWVASWRMLCLRSLVQENTEFPSVLHRVAFHVIRKPDPSQHCDISAVGAPRWCAEPCCLCILFVPPARIPVASAQLISPGQVSGRIFAVDWASHGWSYFKQCFNYTVFGLPLLLQLLCLLHIKPFAEQSPFHSVAFVGPGTTF